MSVEQIIIDSYPELNLEQKKIIGHADGPLLVIAGPGSGKTFSMVLRVINLLLSGKAKPNEIIICTFTEKAALELKDRISSVSRKVNYTEDLSELRATTIHGLCNSFITEYRHKTVLGNNYETLDELTQLLFIFDNFEVIAGAPINDKYFNHWSTKWTTIEGLKDYFNKITEELIVPEKVQESKNQFLQLVGDAYTRYERLLYENNKIDFAHQQKLFYELLLNNEIYESISNEIKYVIVDEYQDTNYIQEQLLLKLSSKTNNICVVGDEDQSIYRFRGATVRNILEFGKNFSDCPIIKLTTNYRSHQNIIGAYNKWMGSSDWSNSKSSMGFRYDKTILPIPGFEYPEYPAVFSIYGTTGTDEANRFAEFVSFLKANNVIHDFNQIALLLHSVRLEHSGSYIEALNKKGIPTFCPRARAYFDNEEIQYLVACYAIVLGYYGTGRGNNNSRSLTILGNYVDECIIKLAQKYGNANPLTKALQSYALEISQLKESETLDKRPADYLYQLLAFEPFRSFVKNENRSRNLAILSKLIITFQSYYHYTVITFKNREYLRYHFFNSFLRLLFEGGINEYEDADIPFPKGHVQIMTIHQSKGLEFPVVVVGSLDVNINTSKKVERDLTPYLHRQPFEPENRITMFDRMRLHYVAFSRSEKILVLTSSEAPKDHFTSIWQGLPQWPYVDQSLLQNQTFISKERQPVKKTYSFTGDLKLYETCPRQYQFYRHLEFSPSRSAVMFFGSLVHQTIEEIHRIVLDNKFDTLNESKISELFEKTFHFLQLSDTRAIGKETKEVAFKQIMNYFNQNQDEMKRVVETEVDVSIDKDGYILTGKVDLLMGSDGKLEVLDFKTAKKPSNSPEMLLGYQQQLCTYAHILEKRYGKKAERLLLYWTSEENKKDAVMEFPFAQSLIEDAGKRFDVVVKNIEEKEFTVVKPPEMAICRECDFRSYCSSEGTIKE
jgi:DNA helicase-2/ATP-dependent DNA helicase PcrA